MISTPDRQHAVELIQEAIAAGARCCRACQELSLSVQPVGADVSPLANARRTEIGWASICETPLSGKSAIRR
jgi:hypothetical protein